MLGLLPLAVSLLCFGASKKEVLGLLENYSYEVDYFSESHFRSVILDYSETERVKKDPSYRDSYKRYHAYGIKAQLAPQGSRIVASLPEGKSSEALRFSVDQGLGLVAFKRGDLAEACPKVVEKARALGLKRLAYFHPVHFSGGNGKDYRMPENPVYGVHWRFETANAFSQAEFDGCMDRIASAGLKLHYVPHLESISTLNGTSDEEWRMLSGIPIDDWYFHHSFGPLLTYLKNNPKVFRGDGDLDLTLAAEIDPMVLNHAKKVRAGREWLKAQLSEAGTRGARFFINTNGDFYHGEEIVKKEKIQCAEIETLFGEIDGVTPSMYGDKGHLKKIGNKLSLSKTLSHFRSAFLTKLSSLCPKDRAKLETMVEKIKVGFGEFAIDESDPEQSYQDILPEAEKDLLFILYWNHGKWDHLGVLTEGNQRLEKELVTPVKVRK